MPFHRPSSVGGALFLSVLLLSLVVVVVQAESLRRGGDNNKDRGNSNKRLLQTDLLSNNYIIAFKQQPAVGTDASVDANIAPIKAQVESSVTLLGGTVQYSYNYALNGFAATLTPDAYNALMANPNIAYIEPDGIATVSTTQTQGLSWGLDRIDQKSGTDGTYTYSATGAGVHVYTIDTGISSTHSEFTGRLGVGYNGVKGSDPSSPQPWDDCHMHGTHVSSTIGGTTYGVAKQVTLHAVRVMNCRGTGTYSDIIGGMDWVVSQQNQNPGQKSVANMSLGGPKSPAINAAAARLVAAGVVLVVAAGNEGTDACTRSPASADNVLAVGATGKTDARSSFSNYGSCVKVFAPGERILGADFSCPTCSTILSGTSMATPHVAGVAALYLGTSGGTPAAIMTAILSNTVNDIVTNPLTIPNKFVQSTLPVVKKCRAAGKSCNRRRLCLSACCCSGLTCQKNSRCA